MGAVVSETAGRASRLQVFKGKRVLLTGHTGFKGSWLALILHALGAEVMGYALAPAYADSHFELLGLDQRINHVLGDVRDFAALDKVVRQFQPEIVFHLAAQALVRESYADPKSTFDINVGGANNPQHIRSQRTGFGRLAEAFPGRAIGQRGHLQWSPIKRGG